MPGFSLTLLLLPREGDSSGPSTKQILSLLDEKPNVPGWRWSSGEPPAAKADQIIEHAKPPQQPSNSRKLKAPNATAFVESIQRAANALIKAEPEITRMDSIAGDGDCGLTLKVRYILVINCVLGKSNNCLGGCQGCASSFKPVC